MHQTSYSIRNCFRDSPPESILAQAFRRWAFGRLPERAADWDAGPWPSPSVMDALVKSRAMGFGGNGLQSFYNIFQEGPAGASKGFTPPPYVVTNAGSRCTDPTTGLQCGAPPPLKTIAEGHDGSTVTKPVWREDGSEYTIMPDPTLVLTGTTVNPITPGVYGNFDIFWGVLGPFPTQFQAL